MAIIPPDFEPQILEIVRVLEIATRDPNIAVNMDAARTRYEHGRRLTTVVFAHGPTTEDLERDLEKGAAGKRRFEAAVERLRDSLRKHGILDEVLNPSARVALRFVGHGTASASDVHLLVAEADVQELLAGAVDRISGSIETGILAWPHVKYPELEAAGSAFVLKDITRSLNSVTVIVGERVDPGSAFMG